MLVEEVAGSAPEQVELVLGGEPKAGGAEPSIGRASLSSMDVVVGRGDASLPRGSFDPGDAGRPGHDW